MQIAFTDIDVSADGWLRCNVTRETTEEFYIRLPYSFTPAHDLIAAAYASLCGQTFGEVTIDLPIGQELAATLETTLQAKVRHRPGTDMRRRAGTENGLNFSGGFDSLAAKEILEAPHLISLDFGGKFKREREFFERFDPLIFSTNLTDLRLNRYSWQFMGIGSILLRDELRLDSYSFGSIQAGSLPRLFSHPLDQSTSGMPLANALGMRVLNPVAGISEIGAISIVAKNNPELLVDVLMSVAIPTDPKFQRKYQMLEAVAKKLNLPLQMPNIPERATELRWSSSFAHDLSSLFVIEQMGAEYVSSVFKEGPPHKVIEGLKDIDLTFLERFNPQAYEGVPDRVLSDWYYRMIKNGIKPYYRKDWEEAEKVIRLFSEA